jgi:hypothetical protein
LLLPIDAVLLLAFPSQLPAQLSLGAVREVEGADSCGADGVDEPKLGSVPRYESVVSAGPLPNEEVVLSGARLEVELGDCGNNIGGAAIVEPILVQSLVVAAGEGFVSRLRSIGVTGVDAPQFDVGGGAGRLDVVVGHGGGAGLLRVAALAGGAAGCWTANGLAGCAG